MKSVVLSASQFRFGRGCVSVAVGECTLVACCPSGQRVILKEAKIISGEGLEAWLTLTFSPGCLSLFLNPHRFCRVKGLLSVGTYLRRSLSKRKCVALVVLRTRVLAPAPLCLIVPSLSFFIFVGNDKIQSSSCFVRQHRWDVLLLCYDQYLKYWWLMLLRVFGAFNFFLFFTFCFS